jgi:hypothetical protein
MSAVMTAPPDIPAANGFKCRIDEVFSSPFIELIGLAPKNPLVRGLILAQTGKLPGAERETFEQIKEWVETTCQKKVRPPHQPAVRAAEGIAINVEFSETEYGRADYTVSRSGSDEFALDADELLELVQEAIDSEERLEDVVDRIASQIDDDAWNRCDPSMDDYGDYDYGDHESSDSENGRVQYSRTEIRDRLRTFLRERHPQLLEELA